MAGNGNGSIAILCIGAFVAGAGLAWWGRGVYDGSVISTKDAAIESQEFVDAGVESVAAVEDSRESVAQAKDRVTVVIKEVPVDADCPPGAGPVSPEWERQLRALSEARSNPSADESGLREEDRE